LYFGLLLRGHVKITGDVSAWYYEDMSTAQTVIIVTNIGEGALKQDAFGPAQLAIRSHHGINPSISVEASTSIFTMAPIGLPVHVRSLVLNHAPMSRGTTDAVYNRYAYDRKNGRR
jgi:hypothetical protein